MMESNHPCELLLPYFLKELPVEEAVVWEGHLRECSACQEQLAELQEVWHALPYEMDEAELPDTMKEQLFERIVQELPVKPVQEPVQTQAEVQEDTLLQPMHPEAGKGNTPWFRSRQSILAAAAIVLIAGAWAAWKGTAPFGDMVSPVASIRPSESAGERYMLKSFDPSMPAAKGMAWVEQKGEAKQLVLKVNGLQSVEGQQAYQLWVIKEGKRYNGGTFHCDSSGNAVVQYDLHATQGTFEALGITLEPDAAGEQPRGKKVLGT